MPSARTSSNTSASPDLAALQTSKPSLISTAPTSTGGENDSIHRFEAALDAISTASACPHDREADDIWSHTASTDAYSDECPDRATLAAVTDIPIYDAEGTPRPFASLYDSTYNPHLKPRQLIIFIRHFYCGACQAYVKALSDGITMTDYLSIPTPTSITLISNGKPDLLKHYPSFTGPGHFPIYTEPTRKLFKTLGMKWSANLGQRPEYMRDISIPDVVKKNWVDMSASIKDPEGMRKRDVFRGGNLLQVGGEFLFEGGEVVWCHRMRHLRGHAEVAMIRRVLELDPKEDGTEERKDSMKS